jgi:hypothetical protein
MNAHDERDPGPKDPPKLPPSRRDSRQEEIEQVITEYANDLREVIKKLRRVIR